MSAYLSARESADYCGVSEKTIRNWIAAGRLSAEKSAGAFRIAQDDLDVLRNGSPRRPHVEKSASAEVRADDGPQSAEGAAPSAAMVELVLLVGRLQTENRDLSAAAAMWQERARVLSDQLAIAAPADSPVAPQPEPEPAATSSEPPTPLWRGRWSLVLAIVAVVLLLFVLVLTWPR